MRRQARPWNASSNRALSLGRTVATRRPFDSENSAASPARRARSSARSRSSSSPTADARTDRAQATASPPTRRRRGRAQESPALRLGHRAVERHGLPRIDARHGASDVRLRLARARPADRRARRATVRTRCRHVSSRVSPSTYTSVARGLRARASGPAARRRSVPEPRSSSVGGTLIVTPPIVESFFIESLPDTSGAPYARAGLVESAARADELGRACTPRRDCRRTRPDRASRSCRGARSGRDRAPAATSLRTASSTTDRAIACGSRSEKNGLMPSARTKPRSEPWRARNTVASAGTSTLPTDERLDHREALDLVVVAGDGSVSSSRDVAAGARSASRPRRARRPGLANRPAARATRAEPSVRRARAAARRRAGTPWTTRPTVRAPYVTWNRPSSVNSPSTVASTSRRRARCEERLDVFGGDGERHALLGLGDQDLPRREPRVLERGACEIERARRRARAPSRRPTTRDRRRRCR